MTEDADAYRFDFKIETDRLQREFGAAASSILFAEVDVTPEKISIQQIVGDDALKTEDSLRLVRGDIIQKFREDPDHSSYFQQVSNSETLAYSYGYVAFRKEKQSYRLFGAGNTYLCRLATLYHEMGHALMRHGDGVDNDHPFQECVADAFTALSLLRRFGNDAIPAISLRSWSRAFEALGQGSTKHMTTPVLERIIADAAMGDFSHLTTDGMIKRAISYAENWTPTPDMLALLRSCVVPEEDSFGTAFGAADTCLGAPDKFSFFIGAKFFQPFLHPEGIVFGDQGLQIDEGHRKYCAELIRERAAGLHLGDIFNDPAEHKGQGPVLEAAIPTRLPQQQKYFTLKFS